MSYLLDQAKAEMERAKREVNDLRRRHNEAVLIANRATAKYNRLVALQIDIDIQIAHERAVALKAGDTELARLLVLPPR